MERQTVRCYLSITQIFPNPHRGSCLFSAPHESPLQKSRLADELFAAIHTVLASFMSFSCMRFLVAYGRAGAATAHLCGNMLTHHLAALKTKAHWCVCAPVIGVGATISRRRFLLPLFQHHIGCRDCGQHTAAGLLSTHPSRGGQPIIGTRP